ncbi:Syntaxin-binding protein 5 [Phytophthora citrophthora]|uniref:Syntaxin-binding protein 5 n=1 Tax=Phytophthora citrophthora TaxID=4793 RepID=A0AAD9G1S2_9STRA|nr:Syntaxin-binding protein 5 [Phytophthora citrophthora]
MGNKASRSTSASQLALDALLSRPSALQASLFSLHATAHHGVPSNAKTLAFCGLQGFLAVGTASGAVKLYGANGLEVLLEAPEASSHLTISVTHLQFTARQRLVVGYTDSSLRVFDLTSGDLLCCVSDAWTTSVITTLETIKYCNFPFFFVATDDGDIHVVNEETGRVSTYVLRPRDLPMSNVEGITALASHPKDANLLLLSFDTYPAVLLWDLAKRKVVREFSLSGKMHKLSSPQSSHTPSETSADGDVVYNSPQCLSWHSTGKRFVAGYKHGGFAVFRTDKSHGLYRYVAGTAPSDQTTPVKQIKWICAPPTSKHAVLPGAIVFSGGRLETSEANLLTVVYPSSSDDALTDLYKSEKLTWSVATIESTNHAEIAAFEVAQDQVDYCVKMAPLSLILLSGNPLDGCLPTVSVQSLPCFVKLCDGDKEDWEWRFDRLPEPVVIPPLLQLSPLKTFTLVNLSQSDSSLQEDLHSTWNQAKYNPLFHLAESGDFEWPINGGSILEPMLKGFLATSGTGIALNSMMILTAHADGRVLFWEAQTAGDRSSKGAIRLLHVVDVPLQMSPAPVNQEVTCLAFCASSRTLVVGFASGEIVILEFHQLKQRKGSHPSDCGVLASGEGGTSEGKAGSSTDQTTQGSGQAEAVGFRTLFSIHVHTESISKLVVASSYGYVAIADAAGMVSLVELNTQNFQLLVCDISPTGDESMSVDSLLVSELVQTTEIPGSGSSPSSQPGGKGSPGKASIYSGDTSQQDVIQHREVIPVLFVGRGSGKLEMYHVQSATKMGETLVDPEKTSSLSSMIMVDGDGKRIEIPGRKWLEQVNENVSLESGLDAAAAVSLDKVELKLGETKDQQKDAPDVDFEITQQFVKEARDKRTPAGHVHADHPPSWTQRNFIQVTVPPGSLGLHLSMEIEQHAVVKGFAEDSSTGTLIASKGVRAGHTVTAINGVDVSSLERDAVCSVLENLLGREKEIIFAEGFQETLGVDTTKVADIEQPRFLVCACGRKIHVVLATVPRAAEMAMGPKEIPAQPLASVELQGPVLVTSVVRVPVGEGIENCLAAVDRSGRVYILSLLSLKLIWQAECSSVGFGLGRNGLVDGVLADVSHGGELVVANSFGEIERLSLFAEATALESAMLERMTIKTRLHLPERSTIFDETSSPSATDSGKKRGIADAGKMFKKLVLSVTHEATDLNKVFQFSSEEDERQRLMGDRSSAAKGAESAAAKTETGLNATKDTLMQAQQRLVERGEKLNDLGLKTEQMKKTSEDFYQTMKAFNEKNANKKWYEL